MTFAKPFRRIIQLELNEISHAAITKLIAKGKLRNFREVEREWFQATTTSEQNYQHLEPWIQWITAHTGKTFAEHKVFHLSDADKLSHPQIWETLSDQGIQSCIIGSMNAVRGRATGGIFFPDPWAKQGITHPETIQPLWDLISKKVQTHATGRITASDLLKGLKVCLGFKLPFSLYFKIIKQLISQKKDHRSQWKMAALFDLMLFYIFKNLLATTTLGYYTLFLNAIAHYQHHYWRNFEKSAFNPNIESPDCRESDDPITFGYELYDEIIGFALMLAKNPDNLVIIASGLSQEPFTAKEAEGGMNYYRLYDHQSFLDELNLSGAKALPLMSRDWQLRIADAKERLYAKSLLSQLTVDGSLLFNIHENSEHSLFIETAITKAVNENAQILLKDKPIGKFHQYFCRTAVKSGHHMGHGVLWLSQKPEGIASKSELPLTALYPLTLAGFGIRLADAVEIG